LLDTAGLRETDDAVEKMGIARTRSAIEKANLVLLMMDSRRGITCEDQAILDSLPPGLPVVYVYNKTDLLDERALINISEDGPGICLSAMTGEGIDMLRQRLLEMAGWQPRSGGEGVFMARQRHLYALMAAREYLGNASALDRCEFQSDLLAEELRLAQQALASITGEFGADALLGEIFSRFCIGK
jgi:tRNA modification GTPase